jgi:Bacterial CdiA-CT RNAse A domain
MASSRMPGPLCGSKSLPFDSGTLCRWASPVPGPIGLALQPNPFLVTEPVCRAPLTADEDGLQMVLTPMELASILNEASIETGNDLGTRFWGAATAVVGALEMVGSAALLLTPEPTALTKIAGVALGAHGADTAGAGVRQVISGQSESTFTASAAQAAAEAFGLPAAQARLIGISVDTAVPLVLGLVGAVRVLAVRQGTLRLAAHEAAGGHTLLRHVGQTEAQLRSRLLSDPRLRAASSFRSLAEAERFASLALRHNKAAIEAWARSAAIGQRQALPYAANHSLGFGVVRSTGRAQEMHSMVVVLRKVQTQDRVYFVLTAYPKP